MVSAWWRTLTAEEQAEMAAHLAEFTRAIVEDPKLRRKAKGGEVTDLKRWS